MGTTTAPDLERALTELIAAIDRRTPHIEQAGEAVIARDAAALRAKAVARLAEVTDGPREPGATARDGVG